jgi:hypothetical protein
MDQLADLWPRGHLLPTILSRYRTLDPAQRARKKEEALEADAERALRHEVI